MNLNLSPLAPQQPAADETAITFVPQGVCSKLITFRVEEGKVHDVTFTGGCPGNLEGIGKLVEGMRVADVMDKLSGIRCGNKATSCPDQLSKALEPYRNDA
ncbi:uncharacterized protein (TIGR03905 family) [Desulfobaculum xiamenense]|uniref:ribonucleoside-diphosphate reductase n=1 Tax=Desulfobaculum xiamenense TaxID=995050 RepID=A0A846QDN5_9BACT|nr:TIGR03905 family TSCPD domain-containing protein [Desulfobaculum xiamenense]NJB66836.1 uncharacterized protein (TIGR03905 family) [Desulfobaculum xiamenense]